MTYLFAQYWIFIALAFVLGMFAGWATCGGAPLRDWRDHWFGWGIAAFLAGLFVAAFKWLPGLTGHLLEIALLLFGAYILGCICGCNARWGFGGAPETTDEPQPAQGHDAASRAIAMAAAPASVDVFGVDSSASYPGARPAALAAPRGGRADDLTRIAGLDAGTARALGAIGVFHYDQIGAWAAPQTQWVEHHLAQAGRVAREDWTGQARRLAGASAASVAAIAGATGPAGPAAGASGVAAESSTSAGPPRAMMTDGARTLAAMQSQNARQAARAAPAPAPETAPEANATPVAGAAPETAPAAPRATMQSPARAAMTDGARSIAAMRAKQARKAEAAASDGRPAPDPAPDAPADDLKLIRGVGPANEAALNGLGVRRFAQIAHWTPENARWIGESIRFPGRIEREHWVDQARFLAAGVDTPHSAAVKSGAVSIDHGADAPLSETEAQALASSLPQQAARVDDEAAYDGARPLGLASPRGGKADDLKLVKGIGRQNEERLHALGVWHFDQIAAWSPDNVSWIGSYLAFPGRIERERWLEQAALLARGETTEFARRAAAGEVPTSSN